MSTTISSNATSPNELRLDLIQWFSRQAGEALVMWNTAVHAKNKQYYRGEYDALCDVVKFLKELKCESDFDSIWMLP